MNNIYQAGNISKGIIYHYFQSKDELYIYCVEECFKALVNYLSEELDLADKSPKEQLASYFNKRLSFFGMNPIYRRLFCEAVIMPPANLKDRIMQIRAPFDEFNINILRTIFAGTHIRPELSREDIVKFFHQYQDFMSARYQMTDMNSDEVVAAYEEDCKTALNIFLYGIIDCNEEHNL